jgi:cation diffusion facilitator family transporter
VPERLQRSLRAVFIGLGANACLAAAKLSAGLLGHSFALVADAVDSLADSFSSLVVWRALVVSAAPADQDHPYGHGKAEPIAAAIVAATLIVSALGIIMKAGDAIFSPPTIPATYTLAILVGSMVVKEFLFRFVAREAEALDNLAMRTDAWHHRSDAIVSLAAGAGLAVSIWGGPNYAGADKIAAIAAAGVIARNGWRLMRPALDELMDRSPDGEIVPSIKAIASAIPGVALVEKCVARKTGYQYLVDMHVEVDPDMTVVAAHEIAHRVKDGVRERLPAVLDVMVHIEPAGRARGDAGKA